MSTKTTLRADGFTCPSCVAKLEKGLGQLSGVDAVKVHFASSRIEVEHDETKTSVDDLVENVKKLGYTAVPSAF